jgi:topoisomerase IA-like protein
VLGPHPRDKKPVELHAGRYGPYVKHGDVNATLPDRDKADSVTLDEAISLLAEKEGKQGAPRARTPARKTPAKTASKPRVPDVAAPPTARKAATTKRGTAPVAPSGRSAKTKTPAKGAARGRRTRTV